MRVSRFKPWRLTAALLAHDDMRGLGIERTSRIAGARNRRHWEPHLRHRRANLDRHLAELRRERKASSGALEMRDGWTLDTSRTLPHLGELLRDMDGVIRERGLQPWEHHGKPFLKDILPERSWERYSSILDFACSPEVLEPMARHAGFVPHLSGSLPPGLRLMESSTKFDPQPEGPLRASQLWHLDYHSHPTIYVIVALRDIGPDDGPLHYLGETASRRVADALRYRSRGAPYRVTDEIMDAHTEPSELRRFTGPVGSVLFVDSSRCFHFGSRRPASPRYHMQYAYISPVRNDFSQVILPQAHYRSAVGDPLSRRLALDRELLDV